MALRGISAYLADSGSWTKTVPCPALTAFTPSVPSVPVPDNMMPTACGPFLLGQRTEKEVHGESQVGRLRGFFQEQGAAADAHVFIGRYQVNRIGRYRQAVRGCLYRHPGSMREDFGHGVEAGQFQVLNNHERQAAIRRQAAEKFFQGLQPTGGSAQRYHGEVRGWLFHTLSASVSGLFFDPESAFFIFSGLFRPGDLFWRHSRTSHHCLNIYFILLCIPFLPD